MRSARRQSSHSRSTSPDAAGPVHLGQDVGERLGQAGFELARIRGSHHVLRHTDGRVVAVPVHSGRDMPPGTLRGILRIIGMSVEELNDLL